MARQLLEPLAFGPHVAAEHNPSRQVIELIDAKDIGGARKLVGSGKTSSETAIK